MKPNVSLRRILLGGLVIFLMALCPTLSIAAEISCYSLNSKVMMDPICEQMKKSTGITVSALCMGGGELWTRVMAEKPNIQADMGIGANIEQAISLKEMGLLIQYKSKAWDVVPDEFKDKDGYYYCDAMWTVMPVVNKELVKKKGLPIPKSWYDLLDPKWKGEIAMPNPLTSSSAYLTLCGLVRLMGEDQAFDYLEKLHKNVAQYTKAGGAPALLVSQGEVTFGITDSSSTFSRIDEGYPIAIAILKEGVPYSLNASFIFTSTKDPARLAASKKITDYLASEEHQSLAGKFRPKVTRPGVVAQEKAHGELVLLKNFDYEWVGKNVKRLQDRWKEQFQKK